MIHVDRGVIRRERIARLVHGRPQHDRPYSGSAATDAAFVQLRRVSKSYDSRLAAVHALQEIDLEVEVGELVVISGGGGSGKTTLIELVGAAQRPTSGEILVGGRRLDLLDDRGRLEFRTGNVALAPQTPTLAPTLSAHETVLQASRTSRTSRPDDWTRTCLEALDLDKDAAVLAADLSADGQQRLSVARALAKDAPLLLLDEPLTSTTVAARARLLAAVPRLIGRATTVVWTATAHDDVPFADRVVRL